MVISTFLIVVLGTLSIVICGEYSIFGQTCDEFDKSRKWSEAAEVAKAENVGFLPHICRKFSSILHRKALTSSTAFWLVTTISLLHF